MEEQGSGGSDDANAGLADAQGPAQAGAKKKGRRRSTPSSRFASKRDVGALDAKIDRLTRAMESFSESMGSLKTDSSSLRGRTDSFSSSSEGDDAYKILDYIVTTEARFRLQYCI